jgi:hypothetical protein
MKCILLILLIGSNLIYGQKIERSLAGFAIGQSKEIARKVLGKPYLSDTSNTGNPLEAFAHPMGDGWVIVFEYNKEKNNRISSIQLSSQKQSAPSGFNNLNFGMKKSEILKLIGRPSDKISIGEYGEKWEYELSSFSIDLDNKGILWAIKLFEPNYESNTIQLAIPSLKSINDLQVKNDFEALSEFVSPSLIIQKSSRKYKFENAWNLETSNDASGVFKLFKEALSQINLSDTINPKQYKQTIIPIKNSTSKFKMSFKKGSSWLEFIWVYEFGSYRIIEILL